MQVSSIDFKEVKADRYSYVRSLATFSSPDDYLLTHIKLHKTRKLVNLTRSRDMRKRSMHGLHTWMDQADGAGQTYSGGTAPRLVQMSMTPSGGARPHTSPMRDIARSTGMSTPMARSRVRLMMWQRQAGWSWMMPARPWQHPRGAADIPASSKKARRGLSARSDPTHVADASCAAGQIFLGTGSGDLMFFGSDDLMFFGSDDTMFFAASAAVAMTRASRRRSAAVQALLDDAIAVVGSDRRD